MNTKMKCWNKTCGNEACFSTDCLTVENKDDLYSMNIVHVGVSGATEAGLCEHCLKKMISVNNELVAPKVRKAALLTLFIGLALAFFAGVRADTAPLYAALRWAGRGMFVGGLLAFVIRLFLAPRILRQTPWKVFGGNQTPGVVWGSPLLVPVGEGYYSNEHEFQSINPNLPDDLSQKIYEQAIATGAWKALVTGDGSH